MKGGQKMDKSAAETWVKVIAILGYIGAALLALVGLIFLFGGSFVGSMLTLAGLFGGIAIGGLFVFAGIAMIIIGVLEFIVALNLWKHKNWARIVMIVLSVLGIIGALSSIGKGPFMSIVNLIINGGIFYLLTFNKDVVALFK